VTNELTSVFKISWGLPKEPMESVPPPMNLAAACVMLPVLLSVTEVEPVRFALSVIPPTVEVICACCTLRSMLMLIESAVRVN
jgi:hypothetical protein